MIISLIAALTVDHVIGRKNSIPWYLPVDIRWFKYHTLYKTVIMGHKTFKSMQKKPLSNRLNIVLSNKKFNYCYYGVILANNVSGVLSFVQNQNEVMIIGGAKIYEVFFPLSQRLYLTYIHTVYIEGDTWFPEYAKNDWKCICDIFYYRTIENCPYNLSFKIFDRL